MSRRHQTAEEAFVELRRAWDELVRLVWRERGDLLHFAGLVYAVILCCLLAAGVSG